MAKTTWKPGTMLYPLPVVMVSCGNMKNPNIITVAWTGTINSDPAMTYVSVRKERFSHSLITESRLFVINLVTENLCRATDYCGVKSGRDENKFAKMNLTPEESPSLKIPSIKESPLSIECKVRQIVELGSHDMFIADIEAVNVEEKFISKSGKLELDKCNLIAYSHGKYYTLGKELGHFGYSVKKK